MASFFNIAESVVESSFYITLTYSNCQFVLNDFDNFNEKYNFWMKRIEILDKSKVGMIFSYKEHTGFAFSVSGRYCSNSSLNKE